MAPYSGAIFEIVALSAKLKFFSPSPKNSTNFPTTFSSRKIFVIVKAKSVAVANAPNLPINLTPTISGTGNELGSSSITASASIPPTPQPRTPRALIIVV